MFFQRFLVVLGVRNNILKSPKIPQWERGYFQDGVQDGRHSLFMAVNRAKFYVEVFFQRMLVICDITIHEYCEYLSKSNNGKVNIFKMASKMVANNANG